LPKSFGLNSYFLTKKDAGKAVGIDGRGAIIERLNRIGVV
jgi:hypothetical protein